MTFDWILWIPFVWFICFWIKISFLKKIIWSINKFIFSNKYSFSNLSCWSLSWSCLDSLCRDKYDFLLYTLSHFSHLWPSIKLSDLALNFSLFKKCLDTLKFCMDFDHEIYIYGLEVRSKSMKFLFVGGLLYVHKFDTCKT